MPPHFSGAAEHLIKKHLRIVTLEQVAHEISSLIARWMGEKKKWGGRCRTSERFGLWVGSTWD
jgi:hypothetical protein